MATLLDHLDLLAQADFPALIKLCGVLPDDLPEMIAELKALNPKPGLTFAQDPIEAVVPDIFVLPSPGGGWRVELNSATLPKVLVNRTYHAELMRQRRRQARARVCQRAPPVGQLAGQGARPARPDGAAGGRGGGRPAAAVPAARRAAPAAAGAARHRRRDRAAREHRVARDRRQVRRDAARQLSVQIFLLQCAARNQRRCRATRPRRSASS